MHNAADCRYKLVPISFTPEGQKKAVFGAVTVHFPSHKDFGDTTPPEYPEDATGPVGISIRPMQAGLYQPLPSAKSVRFKAPTLRESLVQPLKRRSTYPPRTT